MKTTLVALVVCLWSASPAFAQGPILTLEDAIALGLDRNRSVANAALQIDKAEHEVAISRTRRLPWFKVEAQAAQLLRPVDLRFPKGTFGEVPGLGPLPAADATLTTPNSMSLVIDAHATQPLSQLFKLNLGVRLNEASLEREREQLRDARLGLVDEIRRLYYSIAQSRAAIAANDRSVALMRELDRVVERRVAQQVALKADGLSVQSRLAQADLADVSLRHGLASSKERMNQLLGRDLRTPFDVAEIPEAAPVELDLDMAQSRALEARPDVRQARLKVQQAEIAHRVAKADYIPDVGLAVSYLSPMNINGAPRHIASAALQLQWEPFDWGRKGRAVAEKDLEIRQARNLAREAEDRALLEIGDRFRRLEVTRAQVRAMRIGQEAAAEQARVRATQYEVQAALLSDVLQAEVTVADAANQYQQALAAFWSARADFERALGEEGTR